MTYSQRAPIPIGKNRSAELTRKSQLIEERLDETVEVNLVPMPQADVPDTYADVEVPVKDVDYKIKTIFENGIKRLIYCYRDFYKA